MTGPAGTAEAAAAPETYERLMERIGDRVAALDALPDDTRAEMLALLDDVDLLHRAGLERLLDGVRRLGGRGLAERLVEDDVVESLLSLYDLAPSEEARATAAARRGDALVQIGEPPPRPDR